MPETSFFPRGEGLTLRVLAESSGASLGEGADPDARIDGLAALDEAGPGDVSFFDNPRYAEELASTRAGCVVVSERNRGLVPPGIAMLVARDPALTFAAIGRALFPAAVAPIPATAEQGRSDRASVDPTARLEEGVVVEPFAVVGPDVSVGSGTVIGCGAVVAGGCRIGRDCRIGAGVTISHAFLGNRVILHPGVRIGQDGFGYTVGPKGLMKSVQVGRVVVQDDVEIGANTTIDRGAIRDTVIGEGTKIDNQVQIGHNVTVGRHCVIVAQVGISGSSTIGDGVMIGGQSGVNGHVTIGDGAQIAAVSTVGGDVPAGARWGGTPAKPVRDWFKEMTTLSELARKRRPSGKRDEQ